MPIEVELPDGNVVEFPDGTDNATMERALASYSQQEPADFSNVRGGVSSTTTPSTDPTDRMSNSEKFFAGMGKSAVDTYRGIKQASTDSAQRSVMAGTLGLDSLGLDSARNSLVRNVGLPINRLQQSQQSEIDEAKRTDEALMDTKAGIGGNVAGYISQLALPGTWLRGTQFARFALPATVVGNSAQGATLGALQPVATGESRAGNSALGGAFGAGGSALFKAGGLTLGALMRLARKNVLDPIERRAAEVLRDRATGGLADLLRSAPSQVPGVTRTLGEESLDPGVMSLENMLRAKNRSTFDPIDMRNNLARVRGLEGIAGTEADMAAALQSRAQAASSARDAAMGAGDVDISNTLSILDNAIADQQGRPAIQSGLSTLRSLLARDVESAPGLVTVVPETRINVLDNVRQTLGDMLSGKYGGDNAASLAGSRVLLGVRDSLNDEIGRQVPEFADYLNAYRDASKPINRMQIGRELLDSGSASIRDDQGIQRLTPGQFAKANDLDSIARSATGFDKARASDILTQADINLISSVQDDLQRQFRRASSATPGSQTFERLDLADNAVKKSLARSLPLKVGEFVSMLEDRRNEQVMAKLAEIVADPAQARKLLAALPSPLAAKVQKILSSAGHRASSATSTASGATYETQRPLEIDIIGGRPIPADEARQLYGP